MRVWFPYLVREPFGAGSETSPHVHIQGPVEQDSSILKPRFKTTHVPEIIDTVFAKTSSKRSFSMTEYERFGLVFTKTRVYKFGQRFL